MCNKTIYKKSEGNIFILWKVILYNENYVRTDKKQKLLRLIFLTLLFSGQSFAQPGGGGGLKISSFYNAQLGSIDIFSDTSLKIRTFILTGEKIYQETFPYQTFLKENGKMQINNYVSGFGLPPPMDINENIYLDGESNHRMYIVYKKDTMIIDFIGIIGENATGDNDSMDSLVIQKGYFKYYRTKKYDKSHIYEDYDRNIRLIGNGLTLYTATQLSIECYIEFNPNIDMSFLSDKNLPASYFIKRAAYYLQNGQTELAFEDIEKGIERNNGNKNCEILFFLYNAYTKTEQYEKAIENISLAINSKQYSCSKDWEIKVANYKRRIKLFIILKKYDKALEDYDSLFNISSNKIVANLERANFKMKYLKDYKGAINDLHTIIDAIPDDHLSDRPQGWSEYCDTYFDLALAEYLYGDKINSYRHWLKAEEFGYSQLGSDYPIIHFDSIIHENPKVPELYLARALAHFKRGPYLGWGEESKKCFNNALSDLKQAEDLGMIDYRINMYRASVLNELKKYDEAMKEITLAISKNHTDPRCFLISYNIRNNLGQTKWGDKNDTDLKQYNILLQDWEWKKY